MKGKIFNTQEVQAIIAGNKTQFRQICKKQPEGELEQPYVIRDMGIGIFHYPFGKCPYQVGQKIFCKESFVDFRNNNSDIFYKTDFEVNNLVKTADLKWKPAQHMKQEHSRLTLLIKEIKVERLAEISEEDLPQGFKQIKDRNYFMYDTHIKRISCNCGNCNPTLLFSENIRTFLKESAYKFMCPECKKTPNKTYISANGASCDWNDLVDPYWREKPKPTHKKPEEKFEANPFVWVVEFKINK